MSKMLSGAIHFTGRKVCREGGRKLKPEYALITYSSRNGKGFFWANNNLY